MSSALITIADALAESLADYLWTSIAETPTVSRENWPRVDVDDLQDPTISVVPAGFDSTRLARTAHQRDHQVFVFVGRHAPDEATCDEMAEWVEEIVDRIEDHDWATNTPGVTWPADVSSPQAIEVELNPGDALRERNVWRAAITVTYRATRAH